MRAVPSSSPPSVQVFGYRDSQATRAAERFFRERRIVIHLVDLAARPIAPGELRRFIDRLGARALADTDGRLWRERGLRYLAMDDAGLTERLLAEPRLLRLPLVRRGNQLAVGRDDQGWRVIADAIRADQASDSSR
jgi:arsenate reductase-like glutaredoxin family protein